MQDKETKIQSYSIKELRYLYGDGKSPLSVKVFRAWLKPFNGKIGKILGRKYTPKQVKVIFDSLGAP